MTEYLFDHDRLDVFRLSIEYVASTFDTSYSLAGLHRHARDQWLRAAQSIPLDIAEGNGKRSLKDRARFLDIARGSALKFAAIQDVLVVSGGLNREASILWVSITSTSTAMLSTSTKKCQNLKKTMHSNATAAFLGVALSSVRVR